MNAMLASFFIPLLTFTVQIVVPLEVTTIQSAPATFQPLQIDAQNINWNRIVELTFFVILIILSGRILAGHVKVWRIVKKASQKTIYGHSVWVTTKDVPPFSYFRKLIVPSNILGNPYLQTVIVHEKVHIQGQHCLDLCLAEILCLLQWFNPFAWLLKKAIRDNLEFLTDDLSVRQINQQEYQLGMVSLANKTMVFNFPTVSNQSQLKKRIVMMKKTKSIKQRWMKILVIIPVLAILTITLSGREIRMVYPDPAIEKPLPLTDGKEVSGKVTDENNKPLPGVAVVVKDITIGAITDRDGNYQLANITDDMVLSFRLSGYEMKEISVGTQGVINMQLKKTMEASNSQQKTSGKENNTTVVGNWQDIEDVIIAEYSQSPANKPGKHETKIPGDLLIIVDGVKHLPGTFDIRQIDPNDILFMNIVKDPKMAIKFYGETAKNGAVVITTKNNPDKTSSTNINPNNIDDVIVTGYGQISANNPYTFGKVKTNIPDDKLIIIDGEKHLPGTFDMSQIDVNDIYSFEMLPKQKAVELFGELAKNGVIIVTTKNNPNKTSSNGINPNDIGTVSIVTDQSGSSVALFKIDSQNTVKKSVVFHSKEDFPKNNPETSTNNPNNATVTNQIDSLVFDLRNQVSHHQKVGMDNLHLKDIPIVIRSKDPKADYPKENPLYIIDGKKYPYASVPNIDPKDVKNISILRYDSAVAVYGEEGKDGVIIVVLK